MADFKGLFGKFIVVMLFILPLMSLIVVLQNDNDSSQKLAQNNVFNETFGDLLTAIDNATEQAGDKYDVFNEEIPTPGFGSILLFGIVSVTKTFSNVVIGFFLSLIRLPVIVLGLPETIYSLVLTWLTIFVVLVVWRVLKLG